MELARFLPAALCVLFAAAPYATAAPRSHEDEAEAEMLKAKRAIAETQYEVAVGHLLVARSLAPEASGPYLHLGIAYERLGRCTEAVPMLEEYLRRKVKSPHPSAATTLAACHARTQPQPGATATAGTATPARADDDEGPDGPRTAATPAPPLPAPAPSAAATEPPPAVVASLPPAHLTVRVGPVGANLRVNGRPAGTGVLQVEREIAPGSYDVRAEREGYYSASRTGWLVAGEVHVDTLTLRKKRVWPIVVGVLAGAAVAGAVVGIVVTQVGSSSSPGTTMGNGGGGGGGGGGEVGFPPVMTR